MIFIWFSIRIDGVCFYNNNNDILYIDVKKIKRLSVTKNIKTTRGLQKQTTLVTFIIFTPLNQMLLGTIHFAPSNTSLAICIIVTNAFISADKVLLFLKIYRCSQGLSESTAADILNLFWNIWNDRVIPIKTVVLYENPEKKIADLQN